MRELLQRVSALLLALSDRRGIDVPDDLADVAEELDNDVVSAIKRLPRDDSENE